MNEQQIKELALANGFKLKEQPNGEMELNPYVYDFADALLAKANEREKRLEKILQRYESEQLHPLKQRLKGLEQVNLELAANVEACCELIDMDMGAAIDRLFEIDNTESKALLNKFAIENQVKALEHTLESYVTAKFYPTTYAIQAFNDGVNHLHAHICERVEQLRKEHG